MPGDRRANCRSPCARARPASTNTPANTGARNALADPADLQHVGAARVAHRLAAGDGVGVARLQHAAARPSAPRRASSASSRSAKFGISSGVHVAVQRHPALAAHLRGQAVDRHVDLVPAHPQRGRARLGQRQDRLAAEVVGGEQRAHRDRLVDAAEASCWRSRRRARSPRRARPRRRSRPSARPSRPGSGRPPSRR